LPALNKKIITLLASMLVTFVTGSVHAFSVFILPLETMLQLPRSEISLIYSLTLVAITFSVLLGYRIYALIPAWWLIFITCLSAACGLVVAANASGWWQLLIGYSLLFGLANGIGYGFTLQLVGRVMPDRKGVAMGSVTAAYAVGSIIFAKIFALVIVEYSIATAFYWLACGLLACACVAALMLRFAQASFGVKDSPEVQTGAQLESKTIILFWFAYMTAVFSGLMAIGHAAGIASAKNASLELSTLSAMMIGIGSAIGGFAAGAMIDRWSAKRFLIGLPLLSAVMLAMVSVSTSPVLAVAFLSLVGFSYGAIIAIYPVVISDYFAELGPIAYGRIFTAWGFAGLTAPWLAGVIYDYQASYALALQVAAFTALVSAAMAFRIRLVPYR
jgi:OFA family oxalate/formate antiporter-like MFS transporter